MSLLLAALIVLAAGAIGALLLSRMTAAALYWSMAAMAVAAGLFIWISLRILIEGEAPTASFSWPMPLGHVSLVIDALSAWFVLTISLLSLATAIYTCGYMPRESIHGSIPAFCGLLCLLVASMIVVVCAADVMLFLVSWEMMSLSAFFLIMFNDRRPEVRAGAWMYLVATHLGTAVCLLPMFAILISQGGTSFADIANSLHAAPTHVGVVFILGLIGFSTKAGLMPMHVWLPHAHPVAPTPVSALLSGVVVKTGVYGLLRLLSWLPPLPVGYAVAVLIVGIVSGIMGVLYALAQHDIKRLLAYHTVENLGIIALGIGIGMLGAAKGQPTLAALGYAGALLHVLNHAMFKGLLFFSAGAVIHSAGTGEIDRLGGLAKRTPLNSLLFLLGAVAICGLPPLNGFVSEWLIYGSMFAGIVRLGPQAAAVAVAAIAALALMGGLALACFSKVFGVVFLGNPREQTNQIHPTAKPMLAGMLVPAALCVLIGVLPAVALPLLAGASGVVAGQSTAQLSAAVGQVLSPLAVLTVMACIFAAIMVMLMWMRRRALYQVAAPAISRAPTWGCGYAFPTGRMQYSGSSLAWSLVCSFRQLLWPRRRLAGVSGYFPQTAHLETHTDDIAETDLFSPMFRGAARAAQMIRTLSWSGRPIPAVVDDNTQRGPIQTLLQGFVAAIRRGNIQVRLMYIVLALVAVFLIEALRWPPRGPAAPPAIPTAAQITGDSAR